MFAARRAGACPSGHWVPRPIYGNDQGYQRAVQA